ncbi:hypothetical protein Tco_0057779 [Tanacetum coccineum]
MLWIYWGVVIDRLGLCAFNRPIFKKPTSNSSGNKKNVVEPTKEVSNSNTFDVLNLVDNDEELGTNRWTSNLIIRVIMIVRMRDSYENGNYDEDPYDNDMNEGQDPPNKLKEICDNLDIGVRDHMKK